MREITIVGTGYVGLVTGACFAEAGNRVVCCDVDRGKIAQLQNGQIPIYEPGLEEMVAKNQKEGRLRFTTDVEEEIAKAEILYVAVGTPMLPGGEADLSAVYKVAETIAALLESYKIIVIKSTVPVGTSRRVYERIKVLRKYPTVPFDVAFNPEFLREGSAVTDFLQMERAVVSATSREAAEVIGRLQEPFTDRIFTTDLESAEMIKYAANAFLATKITFINEIANLCERVGANIDDVAWGMGLDSRIGTKYLKAGIGYGGSCFPKDTEALFHTAKEAGVELKVLPAVINGNKRQQIRPVEQLMGIYPDLAGRKIAVLGLTFKPNTDDLREAPSLRVIPLLADLGARVRAYDPVALEKVSRLPGGADPAFEGAVSYHEDLYETVEDCDACLILTEWEEIAGMELAEVKRRMKSPVLIDGRNCMDVEQMRNHGFYYRSIGRPMLDLEWVGVDGQWADSEYGVG